MAIDATTKADTVRRAFEGFQRLDMDAFTGDWAENVVWDVSGYQDWPDENTEYKGEAEVIAGFAGYLGSVKKLWVSDLEVTPLEDGRVLGVHRETRVDKDQHESQLDIGTVYEFGNDGKITRVEVYTGHARAREAAGL
jgi:ketosteroid isomerase-like protein